jgi:hypothetical protein
MLNIWLGYVGGRGTNIAPRWDTAPSGPLSLSKAALSAKPMIWGHSATLYFPSIVMLPSMSLSEWLGPKLSSRLLVSTRCPLLAPSVILPTRWV